MICTKKKKISGVFYSPTWCQPLILILIVRMITHCFDNYTSIRHQTLCQMEERYKGQRGHLPFREGRGLVNRQSKQKHQFQRTRECNGKLLPDYIQVTIITKKGGTELKAEEGRFNLDNKCGGGREKRCNFILFLL